MKAQAVGLEVIRRVVYGGNQSQQRSAGQLIPWAEIQSVDW